MKAVAVEFKSSYPPYYKGDIAGFTPEKSADLIKREIAIPYTPKPKEKDNGK